MATIKIKRGLEANRTSITPAEGELIYTTDSKKVYVGDGSTAGGNGIKTDASNISITDSDNNFNADNVEDALTELAVKTDKNGYDRYNEDTMPDVSFDGSTRTVTVSVKSGQSSFGFYVNNKWVEKTTSQTVTIPDTTGAYYIYFDNDGVLQYVEQSNIVDELFYTYAITAFVYWNSSNSTYLFNPDEKHGYDMSGATHASIHNTVGARYGSGLEIQGLTSGSDTYTQSTSGVIYDEDIKHEIAANLSGHKFLYRYGSDGAWRTTTASLDVSYNDGGSYDVWNEWDGSTWKLTEGTSSTDYWIIFYIATPNGIAKIIGQNAYSSRRNARNAIETEIFDIETNGLPNPEFVWLGATIVKRDGKLQAMADGSVFYNLHQIRGGGSGSQTSIAADDVTTDTSNFSNNLSSADTSVQLALETLDSLSTISELKDDTSPELGGNLDWNSKGFILTGQTVGGNDGDVVYLSGEETWSQADASAESTSKSMIGVRINSSTVLTQGIYTTSGLTAGDTYYISETAGAITNTKPTTSGSIVRVIGYALSSTKLFVDVDKTYVENS